MSWRKTQKSLHCIRIFSGKRSSCSVMAILPANQCSIILLNYLYLSTISALQSGEREIERERERGGVRERVQEREREKFDRLTVVGHQNSILTPRKTVFLKSSIYTIALLNAWKGRHSVIIKLRNMGWKQNNILCRLHLFLCFCSTLSTNFFCFTDWG